MRRWLALLLLVWLPLQSLWAVAAPYCQHDSQHESQHEPASVSAAVQHLGHHDHDHAAHGPAPESALDSALDPGVDPANPANPVDTGAPHDHAHCHGCQGHCAALPSSAGTPIGAASAHGLNPTGQGGLPSPAQPRPERPNWRAFSA